MRANPFKNAPPTRAAIPLQKFYRTYYRSILDLCAKKRLEKIVAGRDIHFVDDARIVLVEDGFHQPSGKICVVFQADDYLEVMDLFSKDPAEETVMPDAIAGFHSNKYMVIDFKDILYIESDGSDTRCITKTQSCILKKTLSYYEKCFYHRGILRINKSQLVNLMNVREIVPWFNSRYVLVLENQTELEVSRIYSKALRKTLDI